MKRLVLILTILLGFSLTAFALWENKLKENVGTNKGFGAQLWIVDDPQFFERWNKPSEGFDFNSVNKAKRGVPVFIIILFANPGSNSKKLSDISCDLLVTDPSGKTYGELKDGNCWRMKSSPPEGKIQLGIDYMAVIIEEGDLNGRYTVKAVVHDHVKNAKIKLRQYFDVTKE